MRSMSSVRPPALLAVGVLTHPNHAARRRAVRETWGDASSCADDFSLRLRFVVGESKLTAHEPEMHLGDMLVLPYVSESWSVLLKTLGWLRHALAWGPSWVACVDDDAYVRLPLVLSDLRRVTAMGLSRVMYGPTEWFAFDRLSGILGPWGKNVGLASRAWREATAAPSRPLNLTPPFPFLKGPLMVFDAALARHLVGAACGFPHAYPSPMPSHSRGGGRALHDIAIGYFLSSCPPAGGITLFDVGIAGSSWRSTKGKSAPTGGGFVELRPRLDLEAGVAACLRGVHFGSGPTSAKQRACEPQCAPGAALRACLHVMHAHRGVAAGSETRVRCNPVEASWPNKSRGLVLGHAGWTYCHLQKIAYCRQGQFRPPRNLSTRERMLC